MNEWLYVLLGFFGGVIFTILLLISFIKRVLSVTIMKGQKNE